MYICIYDILAIFDQSWKKEEDRKVLLNLLLTRAKNLKTYKSYLSWFFLLSLTLGFHTKDCVNPTPLYLLLDRNLFSHSYIAVFFCVSIFYYNLTIVSINVTNSVNKKLVKKYQKKEHIAVANYWYIILVLCLITSIKVWTLWKVHKNLKLSSTWFDIL